MERQVPTLQEKTRWPQIYVQRVGEPVPDTYRPKVYAKRRGWPLLVDPEAPTPGVDDPRFSVEVINAMALCDSKGKPIQEDMKFFEPWQVGSRAVFLEIAKEAPQDHPLYPTAWSAFLSLQRVLSIRVKWARGQKAKESVFPRI